MDEAPQTPPAPAPWRDWQYLVLLLLLAAGLRAWVVWRTEVPSRDTIGFIRYALEFEKLPWADVLRKNHQHPGYPLLLWAVSVPVRNSFAVTDADTMQLAAQLAGALAGWLLVIPMFYLGKYLFDAGIGFWGALLFQCLPMSGQILSDGLSEPLYLLLVATALLAGIYAVQTSQPWRYALCGVLCGLTYLTRPEGALVVVAVLLVLLGMQAFAAWRRPWQRLALCGGGLVLGAALVGSPYVLATGALTNKPTSLKMLGQEPEQHAEAPAPRVPFAAVYAVWLRGDGRLEERMIESLWALISEVIHCFHYVGVLPALLGLWLFRHDLGRLPGFWLPAVLSALLVAILWRMAVVVHYVSDRHVLLLVLLGTYPATAFLRELPRLVAFVLRRPVPGAAPVCSAALLLLLVGVGLPRTLQPMHGNRAGYHAAGRWLAGIARTADVVLDDHAWAAYYAGRLFMEGAIPTRDPGAAYKKYAVIGRGKERNPFSTPRTVTEEQMRNEGGEIVWPRGGSAERADVVVWAAPLKRGLSQ